MADAVALGKISGIAPVDTALGEAATYGRFATGDLSSILGSHSSRSLTRRADEGTSLAQGTAGWAGIGQAITPVQSRRRGPGGERVSVTATAAPALPADLEALMRQLKMPYARALAPELIATARAQRWEPVEVIVNVG